MDGDFRRLAEEFQTLVQGFADLDASLAIDAQDEARGEAPADTPADEASPDKPGLMARAAGWLKKRE